MERKKSAFVELATGASTESSGRSFEPRKRPFPSVLKSAQLQPCKHFAIQLSLRASSLSVKRSSHFGSCATGE